MSFTPLHPEPGDTESSTEMADIDWDELKPSQIKALSALVDGHTISEAAALADVARSTLSKWITEDGNFNRAYRAAKSEALDAVSRRLTRLGIKATETLEDVLDNSQSDAIRLRASTDTLNLILKSIEIYEFARRLDELENRLLAHMKAG